MLSELMPIGLKKLNPRRRRTDSVQSTWERLMHDYLDDDFARLQSSEWIGADGAFVPSLDMVETEDKITLSVELPGVNEKDVEVSVDKEYLCIKGEKKREKENHDDARSVFERHYGYFLRRLRLSQGIEADKITAKYHRGVLTIELPKAADVKQNMRKIKIEILA